MARVDTREEQRYRKKRKKRSRTGMMDERRVRRGVYGRVGVRVHGKSR